MLGANPCREAVLSRIPQKGWLLTHTGARWSTSLVPGQQWLPFSRATSNARKGCRGCRVRGRDGLARCDGVAERHAQPTHGAPALSQA